MVNIFRNARIRMARGDGRDFEEIDMTVSMDKKYVTRNGKYDAKVISFHTGDKPVVVVLTHKERGTSQLIWASLNGRAYKSFEDDLDLIEVTEEKPVLTLDDYYAAYEKSCNDYMKRRFLTPCGANKIALKDVLELAGVKV